jgi:ribonucleoside-diphosphate reductase alpha chain
MTIEMAGITLGLQPVSTETLAAKYLFDGERTVADNFKRVSTAIALVESGHTAQTVWAKAFNCAFENGLVGGGRIMAGAGRGLDVTLINCFVEPIGDCMVGYDDSGKPGIMTALSDAAETQRRGGGIGYDFTTIRPRGGYVKGTDSRASGPMSYMDLFDKMTQTVESAGARRGAQMGVLDVSHPDIREFVTAKALKGRWTNFNVSVAISDAFMEAVKRDHPWPLVHAKAPHRDAVPDAYQQSDGKWVYATVRAKDLWNLILKTTYEYAEPGVLFIDRINQQNNLHYVEDIRATNPCAEQVLPPFGCCCLASVNLTKFVRNAFAPDAHFDIDGFAKVVATGVRFLDNVLDATRWPLAKQAEEARNKRRIGMGYMGLGSAMMMLGVRYGSQRSVELTETIGAAMCRAAYNASIELAKERGAFPLFDAEKYLDSGFARTLPADIRSGIAKWGIRNSHLMSIAPTGTMALTFGDNCTNGIEPAFLLSYDRKIRQPDDTFRIESVEDHAFRLYKAEGGDVNTLPASFVTTKDLTPEEHLVVMAAAQKYIDASISKTINCDKGISFEAFGDVYLRAYQLGCKSATTYRPSDVRGAVLIDPSEKVAAVSDPDRRMTFKSVDGVAQQTMRWPERPKTPAGVPSWTIPVNCPHGNFAITVASYANGIDHPFEVWIQGQEAPRGLAAIAKLLSMDMRSKDRRWLKTKLETLRKSSGDSFDLAMPPQGEMIRVGSATSALAALIEYRARELRYFDDTTDELGSPMLSALASFKEPKTTADGAVSWYADIKNPATDDDLVVMIKEAVLEDGTRFPFSVWLSGNYPREWDGLARLLSYDMRICDLKWISAKLKSLARYPEAKKDFWAAVPGSEKQAVFPSTLAYIAEVMLGRYRALGLLDTDGNPVKTKQLFFDDVPCGTQEAVAGALAKVLKASRSSEKGGTGYRDCKSCNGVKTVARRDGCDVCENCFEQGSCG